MAKVLILTCEHAGYEVPAPYLPYFKLANQVLESHRGWDAGALEVANFLAKGLHAPLFFTVVSRLVVEANRSLDSPQLFSEFMLDIDEDEKQTILQTYWHTYRDQILNKIESEISKGHQVIHLSIHSFTPVWEGSEREVELGILYDPDRHEERIWSEHFYEKAKNSLIVRHNEPYQGKDDGFTTYLRTQFPESDYLGIELEINQKFVSEKLNWLEEVILKALLGMKG